MSNREFIHDIVLQVAVIIAFFAIMGAITRWNCARCDAAMRNNHELHGLHELSQEVGAEPGSQFVKFVKFVDKDMEAAR